MCRWIAYIGEPIFLEAVLVHPSHSLLMQSRFALENMIKNNPVIPDGPFPINDDGFGIGWYGNKKAHPGIYRELLPAWNDQNYLALAGQIKSGLFMAHLRAAYRGLVQRSNCHPFGHKNWLFQHNGEISGFSELKRDIALAIAPELFPLISGTTDTEWFFHLAITFGLLDNPQEGLEKAIEFVERLKIKKGITAPFKLTACLSDGESVYAIRYGSIDEDKTLYINKNERALIDLPNSVDKQQVTLPTNARLLVSEPLSDNRENWEMLPKRSFVSLSSDGNVTIKPLSVKGRY